MRFEQIDIEPKTFALIMDPGDEIGDVLRQFASTQKLGGSSFKAIGDLSHVKLGCSIGKAKNMKCPLNLISRWNCLENIYRFPFEPV